MPPRKATTGHLPPRGPLSMGGGSAVRTASSPLADFSGRHAPFRQRNVVVLADALEHEEGGGGFAAIGDEMGPTGPHRVSLAGAETPLLLRIPQKQTDVALQNVEGVLRAGMEVPGHLLVGADLQLGDSEPRS